MHDSLVIVFCAILRYDIAMHESVKRKINTAF